MKKGKKIVKGIVKILYNMLTIICLIFIIIVVMQRVTNNQKSIGGLQIYRVVSGSMEPEYEIGEVVITKQIDANNLNIGDTIVYMGKVDDFAGKLIMHKVVNKYYDDNGVLKISAKGIANNHEDPEIGASQVYGIVVFQSQILTYLYKAATNNYSSFFIIIVLVLNVFLSFKTKRRTIDDDIDTEEKNKIEKIESESEKENGEKNSDNERTNDKTNNNSKEKTK